MARRRFLAKTFFRDAKICSITPLARLVFLAASLEADDETGVFPARPCLVKAAAFPQDDLPLDQIKGLIDELEHAELAGFFEVNDERYGILFGFKRHQPIPNPSAPQYPPPPPELAARCKDAGIAPREKKRKPTSLQEAALIEEFREQFLAHADPGYKGFREGDYPAAEVTAARALLADKRWTRQRISEVIGWVVRDKEEPRNKTGRRWYGWHKVVRSLANLCQRFALLESKARDTVGSSPDHVGSVSTSEMTREDVLRVRVKGLEEQMRKAGLPEEEIQEQLANYSREVGLS